MRHNIIITLLFFQCIYAVSQNSGVIYNLQECIDIAIINNLDLKSAHLQTKTADVNFKDSRNALLPTLNGNYNIGSTSGRSIDPFTNSYINEQLTFSNAGLSLRSVVFNGFQLINRLRQQKLNLLASEMESENAKHNLVLNVTLAYLQVINTKDLYELAKNRLSSTNDQFNRLKSMFEEDMGDPSEYRDFQGLKANDEANLINSRNNYEDSKITLKELLNINVDFDITAIDIPSDFIAFNESFEDIYSQALENMGIVKADEYRLQASEKGVSVAKSNFAPEISFFANLNTNYSSAARFFNETGSSVIDTGDFVTFGGQDYPVFTEQPNLIAEDISYNNQFENNINSSFGIAVNIPLFNGFFAKNSVGREKIKKEEATIQ
jgi:outer membrane protein